MTEPELEAIARAVRDSARKEDKTMLKAAVWNHLPDAVSVPHRMRCRYLPALATSATGVTVVGVVVWASSLWLPGAPLAPALAFSKVEKAMQEVHTAQWTERTEGSITYPAHGNRKAYLSLLKPSVTHVKVRLGNMPRVVSVDTADFTSRGDVNDTGWRSVDDGETILSSHISGLSYVYHRSSSSSNFAAGGRATPAERIRSLVLFPRVEAAHPSDVERQEAPEPRDLTITKTLWVSHPDMLNGSAAVRWDSDWTYTAKNLPRRPQVRHLRIWVHPDTSRVVRREEETDDRYNGVRYHSTRISEDYRYNVPSGDEHFAISPPPVRTPFGYRDWTRRDRWDKSITDTEQAQIRAVVQQAVRAWDRHDTDGLARAWDFGFERETAQVYRGVKLSSSDIRNHERHWRTRAAKGIPYRRWAIEDVRFAGANASIYTRRTANDPFPPRAEPNVFAVTVSGQVRLENGERTSADATITLHKSAGGMKIVYINMYTKPVAGRRAARK